MINTKIAEIAEIRPEPVINAEIAELEPTRTRQRLIESEPWAKTMGASEKRTGRMKTKAKINKDNKDNNNNKDIKENNGSQ